MERVSKTVLAALRRVAGPERPVDLLAAVWPLIVGARVAEHTRPVAWEEGRVEIAVNDGDWQKQLERMPHQLCTRINKWWGRPVVTEVSFVRTTSAPRERHKSRSLRRAAAPRDAHSSDAVEELEAALARIRDKELRGLVARLAQRYLSGKRD